MDDAELYAEYCEFLTEERQAHFERIARSRTRHITIVLEDIYQSQNASAVLRTCDLTGIQDVHIVENKNHYTVNKDVSLGSSKWLDLKKYERGKKSLVSCITNLKEKGYRLLATSPENKATTSLENIDLEKPLAIFFGTELTGLSQDAFDACEERMYVPMHGFTESFNISVCAAITLYTLTQKLHKTNAQVFLSEEEQLRLKIEWAKKMMRNPEALEKRIREKNN